MTPQPSAFDTNAVLNLGQSDGLPFLTGLEALMESGHTGFALAPIVHFDSPLGESLVLGETLAFSPVEADLAVSVSGDLVGSSRTLLPTAAGDSLTHSDSEHSHQIAQAMAQVRESLQSWRGSNRFASDVRAVYGRGVDMAQAAAALDNLLGAAGPLSNLQVVDSLGSAEGAYAAANDTIYLSEKFVSNPNQTVDDITRVIIEELGHALDARLNEADTAGDEGALLAAEVMGEKLSAAERAAISAEDDSATVVIDGQELAIEQSASAMDALLLTAGSHRTIYEQAVVNRLFALGFTVVTDSASNFEQSDADAAELLITTASSGLSASEVDDLDVPVVALHKGLFDEFRMVSSSSGSWLSGSATVSLDADTHPITDGITGEVSLFNSPAGWRWAALPNASATQVIAEIGRDSSSSLFAYDVGDALTSNEVADARMVAFLGYPLDLMSFTPVGWQLFDNAVNWAVGAAGSGSPVSFDITLGLSNDTGDNTGDFITSDPTIAGQLSNTTGLTTFEARLGDSGDYTDILAELQPDGSFVLDLADLEELNGGLLGSGDYTAQVRAGDAAGVSNPTAFNFTYEPDLEEIGLPQETIDLALSEFGFDLATVNFSTIVLEDDTVVVRTENNRVIVLPRYGGSSGGGGGFGGFGSGYGGGGSGFRPWTAFNYGPPSGSPSNPGDPPPPADDGFYIQSIDGNGFRVIYERVDLSGSSFVHKPKTIETDFGNVNFFYHDQADSTLGVAKGDFDYTDDLEVFEVLLAAVGAESVDDVSDIFVTGPFTQSEALAENEAERIRNISDLWSRIGYIGIASNVGIQDLDLAAEERKQLLDFQENLLKATALTDEFKGFGREEDALLLGEMTQLARVYAALDPQLEEGNTGGETNPAPNESLDVLFLRASGFDGPQWLNDDFDLVETRLDSLGFNVTVKNPTNFLRSDAEGMELIVTTGGLYADKTQFDNLDVPIVALHNYIFDELGFVSDYSGASSIRPGSGVISFDNASHPLSNNLSGNIDLFDEVTNFALYTPGAEAIKIGTKTNDLGTYSPIFAYEKGATLANGDTAAERRVSFIGVPDSIGKLNDTGWDLFDATVDWAISGEKEEKDLKQFQSNTVFDFFANTIWKVGNLEQSTINEFKEEFTDFSEVVGDSTIGIDYLGKLFFVLNETEATKETIQNNFAINEFFVEGTSFTSSIIFEKEAEVNGDELFLEIFEASSDGELSQIAEDINTLINDALLLASEDNILSNFHQQINDLSDTIEIPDDAIDWNLLGVARWKLGIDDINDFKNEWIYDYRNAINMAAAVFDIPNILIAGIAHIEVGGGLGAEDSLIYNVRRIPGTGNIPGQVGYPPTTTSFGNMSIQIATAASTLRYYGDPEELEPEVKASIIDSLIDPIENILIAAAHLSDIRNIYFPEKDGSELSERDLMTIAGAYNAGTSYTVDELWEFGYAGGYGRSAVQERVSEHNLEQLLRGER